MIFWAFLSNNLGLYPISVTHSQGHSLCHSRHLQPLHYFHFKPPIPLFPINSFRDPDFKSISSGASIHGLHHPFPTHLPLVSSFLSKSDAILTNIWWKCERKLCRRENRNERKSVFTSRMIILTWTLKSKTFPQNWGIYFTPTVGPGSQPSGLHVVRVPGLFLCHSSYQVSHGGVLCRTTQTGEPSKYKLFRWYRLIWQKISYLVVPVMSWLFEEL